MNGAKAYRVRADSRAQDTDVQIRMQEVAMATNTMRKCAHPACDCEVTSDDKYCSTYCQDAGDTMEISCNCGHPGCAVTEPVGSRTKVGKP
jgi:hypothetical protein